MGAETKRLPNGVWQLPRSKRDILFESENTLLATREKCETMGLSALIVQRRKREKLLQELVGTLYKSIVVDEMVRIEELIDGCRRGYSDPPQELLDE